MKTNIRLNNYYILKKGDDYFLTDIDQLNELNEIEELDEYLNTRPITDKIKELLDEFNESDNVNFILKEGIFLDIKNNINVDPLKKIKLGGE